MLHHHLQVKTVYTRAINDYFSFIKTDKFDSLMSVTPLRVHVWDRKGEPVNYKRGEIRWPRSQQVDPLFEVNSAIFINSRENYIRLEDRIGLNPLFI